MTHTLIPLEDVATMPAPGLNFPVNVSFSPDSQLVAFLHSKENELSRQLYALDVRSKQTQLLASPPNQGNTEVNLSLEEKLRRERQRQMGVGITAYAWCPTPHSSRILYPIQGDLYIQEQPGAELRLLFDKTTTGVPGGVIDPQFSPDGRWIAFVQDKEVYVISSEVSPLGSQIAVQLTTGARGHEGKTNGLACFLTQEELSRFRGFWWSPDSSHIAFEEIDESVIEQFRIMHSGSDAVGAAAQEDHRYPFAGGANPLRRLGVVAVRTLASQPMATPVWMDFGDDADYYVSRVNWLPDQSLGVQKLNRLQTEVTFLRFDTATGAARVLIHETNPVWVNANYLYRSIEAENKATFRFIWGSERSGFLHLYLYEYVHGAPAAQLLGALTGGDWCVESIDGVDLTRGKVYFSGTVDSPLERHLYVTSLYPGEQLQTPVRLTAAEGMHSVVMDSACKTFVDVYSNLHTPPTARVCAVPTDAELTVPSATLQQTIDSSAFALHDEVEARVKHLAALGKLPPPELISFPTRDGAETLYGAVYHPDPAIHGPGPYPTLVSVYGGPHVQRVARMWAMTVDMRAQRFRDMGYAVLKVDNRGSFRRGSAFEGAIKHCMGTVEILDQQDGVEKLIADGVTQRSRVGIYGWSYGGYMSAISLLKAPETFKLAIAGAPVTSWDGYDSCYTERYMSTPQLNPEGYREGSVMEVVPRMQAAQKLLLIHGLIDENVHFRHTARLISALISARKHYDLLLFPSERHSPRGLEDRIYMEQRIAEYVVAHL